MTKLAQVNTTDIADAIRLGCQTMSSVFNADDNDIPYFGSRVWPDAELSFSAYHSESHVPGRHLNALLTAEHVLGLPLDESAVQKHARAAFFSFSGPIALPLNRETLGGPLRHFFPHNIREGLHALYALIRYRQSDQARQLAEAAVAAIDRYWDARTGWDVAALEGPLGLKFYETNEAFMVGVARAIGPLVKIYRATGHGPTLALALRLKDKVVNEHLLDDAYDPARLGTHVHSVTCVLSSLAQLADLTADRPLLARVQGFYDHGAWDLRDALGWAMESSLPAGNPDFGEVNSTGDLLETALILGRWGDPRYYSDAEQMVRGHMLPSQLRDTSFIKEPDNPTGVDAKRDLARRHRGAFGFPAPYGHHPLGVAQFGFNLDIVGGAVASLCEAYAALSARTPAGHKINLLFDQATDELTVESPYTHDHLQVTVHTPAPLWVRLPAGVEAGDVTVGDGAAPAYVSNGYVFIAEPPVNTPVTLVFALPERALVLHHRTRDIRVRLRGEEVTAMDNFGADLTYFDPLE